MIITEIAGILKSVSDKEREQAIFELCETIINKNVSLKDIEFVYSKHFIEFCKNNGFSLGMQLAEVEYLNAGDLAFAAELTKVPESIKI